MPNNAPIVPVRRFLARDFNAEVQRLNSPYHNCQVIAMTHCKNPIYSAYLHEYVHLLICDSGFRKWTRVIAERKRRDDPDQVIIGVWPWTNSSFDLREGTGAPDPLGTVLPDQFFGGEPHDYQTAVPVLLRNMIFRPQLNLRSVANVLQRVSDKSPKYTLMFRNCYWYANGVYEALKVMTSSKETRFYSLESMGRRRYVLYAKYNEGSIIKMQEAAAKFILTLRDNAYRGANEDEGGPQVVEEDPVGVLAQTGEELDLKIDQKAIEIMKDIGGIDNLDESATREEAKNFNDDLREFTKAMLKDADTEKNLAAYNERVKQCLHEDEQEGTDDYIQELGDAVEKIGVDVMSTKEEEEYQEAIRAFVGSVLRDM